MKITLFGGNGFIGRTLAAALAQRGHSLFIPVRNRERAKTQLILLPNTDVCAFEADTMAHIKKGIVNSDAVVNLVGILNESERNLFDRAHGEFVRLMIDNCIKHQIPRVVQMSAIGAAPGAPSAYLRSKAKGEQIVKSCDSVSHVIVRPSVVFGAEDSFINKFAALLKVFPFMPLPMADARFQPIHVNDLVTMIADVLEDDTYHNKVLHAGGPDALSLEDIIRRIAQAMGKTPRLMPLGSRLSYLFAAVAEKVPFAELITRDNCLSMKVPSVCPNNDNAAEMIGKPLTSLEVGLTERFASAAGYGDFRHTAGRAGR